MKSILFVITVSIFVSCTQSGKQNTKSNGINNKSEAIGFQDTIKQVTNENIIKDCLCPKPFSNANTQIKIPYGERFLKFCSFDFDSSSNRTYELRICTDQDSILLDGNIPTIFEVQDFKSPLTLIQYSEFPKDFNSYWEFTPIFKYQFILEDGKFKILKEYLFDPIKVSENFQDSILLIFNNQPEHHNNWNNKNPPFTSEEYIMKLFICAVNDNEDCINAFDNLQKRFVTDGAISELYYELFNLLLTYKEIKNLKNHDKKIQLQPANEHQVQSSGSD